MKEAALATFSDLVSAALNYGSDHPGLTPEDIKKIRMTNIACGIQSLNIVSLTLIIMAFEVYSFAPMVAFELLGLFACFYFQKKGRFTLAKTLFYIPILFGVAIACAGFEEKLQVIVYGFPLTTALFLLYGR